MMIVNDRIRIQESMMIDYIRQDRTSKNKQFILIVSKGYRCSGEIILWMLVKEKNEVKQDDYSNFVPYFKQHSDTILFHFAF